MSEPRSNPHPVLTVVGALLTGLIVVAAGVGTLIDVEVWR